jgi:NAD-dependent SIR2 family protein deacetylase
LRLSAAAVWTSCGGGVVKSETISFDQMLVPEVIERAMAAEDAAPVLFAIGSTLQVFSVAGAAPHARDVGLPRVIVIDQPTPMDDMADAVFACPLARRCGRSAAREERATGSATLPINRRRHHRVGGLA